MQKAFFVFIVLLVFTVNSHSLNIEVNPNTELVVPMYISECEPLAKETIISFADSQNFEVNMNTFRVTAVEREITEAKVQWTVDVKNGSCNSPDVIIQFSTIKRLGESCDIERSFNQRKNIIFR